MIEAVRYTYPLRPGRRAQAAPLDEWGRWLWVEAGAAELAEDQRKMARRRPEGQPASKGYRTAKRRAARIAERAARQHTHDARA